MGTWRQVTRSCPRLAASRAAARYLPHDPSSLHHTS
jgi:hypothetical protein